MGPSSAAGALQLKLLQTWRPKPLPLPSPLLLARQQWHQRLTLCMRQCQQSGQRLHLLHLPLLKARALVLARCHSVQVLPVPLRCLPHPAALALGLLLEVRRRKQWLQALPPSMLQQQLTTRRPLTLHCARRCSIPIALMPPPQCEPLSLDFAAIIGPHLSCP